MKDFNSVRAKFVYSAPITKSIKVVYTDANGTIKGINKSLKGKSVSLPRYTVCSVLNDETRTLAFGIARCSPKDAFSKKIGRELSYERAIKNPICEIQVPDNLKISDVTIDIAYRLMERYEKEHTLKF